MAPPAVQEVQGLGAIAGHAEVVDDVGLLERLLGQHHVPEAVLHQEDLDRLIGVRETHSRVPSGIVGMVNENVLPRPGWLSTQIRPPCRSTIFLQTARPIPVPGYSSR